MGTKVARGALVALLGVLGVAADRVEGFDDERLTLKARKTFQKAGGKLPDGAGPEAVKAATDLGLITGKPAEPPRKYRLKGLPGQPDRVEMHSTSDIALLNKARKDERKWEPDDTDAALTGGRGVKAATAPKPETAPKPTPPAAKKPEGKPAPKAADPDRVPLTEAMAKPKGKKHHKKNGAKNGTPKPADKKAVAKAVATGKAQRRADRSAKTAAKREAGGKTVGGGGVDAFKALFPKGGKPVAKADVVVAMEKANVKEGTARSYMTWSKRSTTNLIKNPFGFVLVEEKNKDGTKTLRRK